MIKAFKPRNATLGFTTDKYLMKDPEGLIFLINPLEKIILLEFSQRKCHFKSLFY